MWNIQMLALEKRRRKLGKMASSYLFHHLATVVLPWRWKWFDPLWRNRIKSRGGRNGPLPPRLGQRTGGWPVSCRHQTSPTQPPDPPFLPLRGSCSSGWWSDLFRLSFSCPLTNLHILQFPSNGSHAALAMQIGYSFEYLTPIKSMTFSVFEKKKPALSWPMHTANPSMITE